MKLSLSVSPYKTAGQGFSVAPLYMDVLIKLNTKAMTGYGLRFQRTTKYGNAVDCYFVKYENGKVTPISKSVTFGGYRSVCKIEISSKGDKLAAHVSTTSNYSADPRFPEIRPELEIQTSVEPNTYGGLGIQYNGGSTTMINTLHVFWE